MIFVLIKIQYRNDILMVFVLTLLLYLFSFKRKENKAFRSEKNGIETTAKFQINKLINI